jgi:hypothetical protein
MLEKKSKDSKKNFDASLILWFSILSTVFSLRLGVKFFSTQRRQGGRKGRKENI